MGLFDSAKGYLKTFSADKKKLNQAKHYADLNHDGKLNNQDVAKAKPYEAEAQTMLKRLEKR